MTCLAANMRVFGAVVNIFRMSTAMLSSAQFSVRGRYLMTVAFCSIIFFALFNHIYSYCLGHRFPFIKC